MRLKITAVFTFIATLAIPLIAGAATTIIQKLQGAGTGAGYSTAGNGEAIFTYVGFIINIALSVLGVIFLVLIVYGGYVWMTAGGDEAKVEKSKQTIGRAAIGLIIVLCSLAIANFVVPQIYCASNPSAAGCPNGLLTPDFMNQ